MKKKLPFEEALENKLQQLTLPDQDLAWQHMSDLLDQKQKKKAGGYRKMNGLVLILLLLLCGVTSQLLIKSRTQQKIAASPLLVHTDKGQELDSPHNLQAHLHTNNIFTPSVISEKTGSAPKNLCAGNTENTAAPKKHTVSIEFNKQESMRNSNAVVSMPAPVVKNKKNISLAGNPTAVSLKINSTGKKSTIADFNNTTVTLSKRNTRFYAATETLPAIQKENITIHSSEISNPAAKNIRVEDSSAVVFSGSNQVYSPIKKEPGDNQITADSAGMAESKKENTVAAKHIISTGKTRFSWSVGIAMRQQIPVGKITTMRYGFTQNGNGFNDYIPALYIRLGKPAKWFAQLEFEFAAPRAVSNFSYSRQSSLNSFSATRSTTTLQLKKVYYHQSAISFNYNIQLAFSIGAGFTASSLYRSVSEQEQRVENLQTRDVKSSTQLIRAGFTDSFFYQFKTGLLLQSNYDWRKWGIGLRWSADLQPYIKYKTPEGNIRTQKSWALEFLLRYRLWRK